MGTVVNGVSVKLTGTKHAADGPLLITHWGLSGPAILRLSSYGARLLAEKEYKMDVSVNWFGDCRECEVLDQLRSFAEHNPQKQLSSIYPEQFVQRHWLYLLSKAGLPHDKRWQETGPKQMTRLASLLTNDIYHIEGKGAYKEEFVTCGGVSLAEIAPSAMECRKHPQLYFAGEVLDVDAVTGGFNLQAAWSMGYACAKSISSSMR
jgi:predicted Rossmann fold flavoprotein